MACEIVLGVFCPHVPAVCVSRTALWQRFWCPPFPGASCRTGRSTRSTKLPNLAPFRRLLGASLPFSLALPLVLRRPSRSRLFRPLPKCYRVVFFGASLSALAPDLPKEVAYLVARRIFPRHTQTI